MTTYKTLNIQEKTINTHSVIVKEILKTIKTGSSQDLDVKYFEVFINGNSIGSHEVGQRQLDWMLNVNNIDKYAKFN